MTWLVLPLGVSAADLPSHDNIIWQQALDEPVDAVLASDLAFPAQWEAAARQLDPLVPVIALGESRTPFEPDARCAEASAGALDEALASLAPIRNRIADLPPLPLRGQPQGERLAILALSHSRDAGIAAQRCPLVPSTVAYPLLRGRPGINHEGLWTTLESLVASELLTRRFAARVFACPDCESGRLSAFEACDACGSGNLFEESILHHYRCGFQDGESAFVRDTDLICPKCKGELRHFGVDYGRPGHMIRCRHCRHVMTDPRPAFHCLDCGAESRGEEAQPRDWFHYVLTPRGTGALRTGALPDEGQLSLDRHVPRTRSWHDFNLLVREQLRIARRYDRDFAVGCIRIRNLPAMREALGMGGANEALGLFSRIIVENLRKADFVSVPRDHILAIALPETGTDQVKKLLARISETAAAKLSFGLDLHFHCAAGDGIEALLEDQFSPTAGGAP